MSKSQKKIIKRVTKCLKDEECIKNCGGVDTEQAEREPLMDYESYGNLHFNFKYFLILIIKIKGLNLVYHSHVKNIWNAGVI